MDELLERIRKRHNIAESSYSTTRKLSHEDYKFFAGNSDNNYQWPQDVLQKRGSRPKLTLNRLPQHVNRIVNEARRNRPTGRTIPASDDADVKMAECYDEIIRRIFYASKFPVAFDTAMRHIVISGEGYMRLYTDFCDPMSFDQDIFIQRIVEPATIYMDPEGTCPVGSDAKYAFVDRNYTIEEFEKEFPKASPVTSITLPTEIGVSWLNSDQKTVLVTEYFEVTEPEITINLYPGGRVVKEGTPEDKKLASFFKTPSRTRKTTERVVKAYKSNGFEILDEKTWPGQYIPIIRFVGDEFLIDGTTVYQGIVRNAKDAQRMYNYWRSQETEMLALSPKAPFIGYSGQFEGYEEEWKTANTENHPYLEVNREATDAEGKPLPLPQRVAPPIAQNGLLQAAMGAAEDIKSTTGQYDASLGQISNERSGKAILARRESSELGTFHYIDNAGLSVQFLCQQIVELIPKIYDKKRIVQILKEDNKTSDSVTIDPEADQAYNERTDPETNAILEKIYNPSKGKYSVVIDIGPGYATKRQEATENMAQILQANPQLFGVAGDLFAKNLDWPGANELYKRLKKTIPPELLDDDETPQLAAAKQQIEQLEGQLQQVMGMLKNVESSYENRELEIKQQDADTKRLSVLQPAMTTEDLKQVVFDTLREILEHDRGENEQEVQDIPGSGVAETNGPPETEGIGPYSGIE